MRWCSIICFWCSRYCVISCFTMETSGSLLVCLCVGVLVIHVAGQVGSLCRPNERFLSCGGCQKTCEDPAPQCVGVCKTGCYCNDDEVRNETGHCVKLSECPSADLSSLQPSKLHTSTKICPENEEYRFCEPCNKTCDNPNPICPAQCARGCFCAGDLVRDKDGRCVRVEECSNLNRTESKPPSILCGPHQVFSTCQKCEETCRDHYPVCFSGCQAGCFCEEGYLKTPSGECVKIEDCPKAAPSCPPNERYLSCGGCLRTCDMPDADCGHACLPGCYCRQGEVRDTNGRCIKLSQCPKVSYELTCGPHQVYNACQSCEMSCISPTPVCSTSCSAGCFCEEGYVKAPSGSCVRREECPQAAEISIGGANELSVEDCQPDEVYLVCGWCEPSCSEPRPACPVGVCTRGCLCRPPLLRHHSGHCVEENDCVPQRCSDPNEEYVCRYGCEARCDNQKCFARPRRCELGCHCKLGLLRDITGRCVNPDNCSPRTIRFHPLAKAKSKTNSSKTIRFINAKNPTELDTNSLKHIAETIKTFVEVINTNNKQEVLVKKSLKDILSLASDYYNGHHQVDPINEASKYTDSVPKAYKLVTFARPEQNGSTRNTFKIDGNTAISKVEKEKPAEASSEVQGSDVQYKQNLDSYVNDVLNAMKDFLPESVNFTISPLW